MGLWAIIICGSFILSAITINYIYSILNLPKDNKFLQCKHCQTISQVKDLKGLDRSGSDSITCCFHYGFNEWKDGYKLLTVEEVNEFKAGQL